MRKLYYIFIILTIISCNKINKQIDNKYMDEYRYPTDSMINPKVFVYFRNDCFDTLTFILRQVKVECGKKIYITVILDNDKSKPIRDSSVSYYQGKNLILRDEYTLVKDSGTTKDRVIKSEILDYYESSKKRVIKIKYPSPVYQSIVNTYTEVEQFEKKTNFKIYDKNTNCVIMSNEIVKKIRHKYIPFIGKNVEKTGITIYAKGFGMVYARTFNKTYNVDNSLRLKEIIDYPTYLRKYCEK